MTRSVFLYLLLFFCAPAIAHAQYDPEPAWPLCGNYYLTAPAEWDPATDGCPSSRWGDGFEDLVNDTYGPRLSTSNTYDWHRGLDLHTHDQDDRPVFAITCGKVKTVDSGYNGSVVIEHYPGHDCATDGTSFPSCGSVGGCYYSRYKHLASAAVAKGEKVEKGELVGRSGRNCSPSGCSAYPHVHFEIRQAPGAHDAYGRGQRDAIHPLAVLDYDNSGGADNVTVTLVDVDLADPTSPVATVDVTIPNDGLELDLVRVDLLLYGNDGTTLVPIDSPNPGAGYPTPEGDDYAVHPPYFDMELWSRHYNYKDNSKLPYEDFLSATQRGDGEDGAWMSPYADPASAVYDAAFPTSYDADFHLEAQSATDPSTGDFNGLEVHAPAFNRFSTDYVVTLTFKELPDVTAFPSLCVKAYAVDARGSATNPDDATWGNCATLQP